MPVSAPYRPRMLEKLRSLYGNDADSVLRRIDLLADRYAAARANAPKMWDERSIVLITYGDQIREEGRPSLEVLQRFLVEHNLHQIIRSVHLLPCFPYSSDDGFSVIDYRRIDPALGDWNHINRLRQSFGLMLDLVLNHCSQQHEWFQRYLEGVEPYTNYFIDVEPGTDLSQVTRPRSWPLLTPFETRGGTKHVWTTFSDDQVDLNYANPDVLVEMLDVLLLYVEHGASVIRLDAIAYLWKTIGTSCIHLPQTHTVVKLMRDVLEDVVPGTALLTETNVPHKENVSYFGDGDEAHAVYQFSLAPLLLDAYLTGDAVPLNRWLAQLEPSKPGTTFFNFTASHDGIGVRPLEGLVADARLESLIESVRQRGGRVSTKKNPDGTDSPYELNISYLSALDSPDGLPAGEHTRRFLATQAVMLALRGVPGIYFHSLVGTPNDVEGMERTGHPRTINRRKYEMGELCELLHDMSTVQSQVFEGYRKMLAVRVQQPAFHPEGDQTVVDPGGGSVVSFIRTSLDREQQILVLANVSDDQVAVDLKRYDGPRPQRDLLSRRAAAGNVYDLAPYEVAWLA